MRKPSFTRQFEKDLKRMKKRGKEVQKIKEVISLLIAEEHLAERYRDHIRIFCSHVARHSRRAWPTCGIGKA